MVFAQSPSFCIDPQLLYAPGTWEEQCLLPHQGVHSARDNVDSDCYQPLHDEDLVQNGEAESDGHTHAPSPHRSKTPGPRVFHLSSNLAGRSSITAKPTATSTTHSHDSDTSARSSGLGDTSANTENATSDQSQVYVLGSGLNRQNELEHNVGTVEAIIQGNHAGKTNSNASDHPGKSSRASGVHSPSMCCAICPKSFSDRSQLRHHERIHDETKTNAHACAQCGRGFQYPKDLRRHEKIHWHKSLIDATKWECSETGCDKSYQRHDNLRRHLRCAHPEVTTASVSDAVSHDDARSSKCALSDNNGPSIGFVLEVSAESARQPPVLQAGPACQSEEHDNLPYQRLTDASQDISTEVAGQFIPSSVPDASNPPLIDVLTESLNLTNTPRFHFQGQAASDLETSSSAHERDNHDDDNASYRHSQDLTEQTPIEPRSHTIDSGQSLRHALHAIDCVQGEAFDEADDAAHLLEPLTPPTLDTRTQAVALAIQRTGASNNNESGSSRHELQVPHFGASSSSNTTSSRKRRISKNDRPDESEDDRSSTKRKARGNGFHEFRTFIPCLQEMCPGLDEYVSEWLEQMLKHGICFFCATCLRHFEDAEQAKNHARTKHTNGCTRHCVQPNCRGRSRGTDELRHVSVVGTCPIKGEAVRRARYEYVCNAIREETKEFLRGCRRSHDGTNPRPGRTVQHNTDVSSVEADASQATAAMNAKDAEIRTKDFELQMRAAEVQDLRRQLEMAQELAERHQQYYHSIIRRLADQAHVHTGIQRTTLQDIEWMIPDLFTEEELADLAQPLIPMAFNL